MWNHVGKISLAGVPFALMQYITHFDHQCPKNCAHIHCWEKECILIYIYDTILRTSNDMIGECRLMNDWGGRSVQMNGGKETVLEEKDSVEPFLWLFFSIKYMETLNAHVLKLRYSLFAPLRHIYLERHTRLLNNWCKSLFVRNCCRSGEHLCLRMHPRRQSRKYSKWVVPEEIHQSV